MASDLQLIPGIGKAMEQALFNIGVNTIADLKNRDPEELYLLNCQYKGYKDDNCVLYVFRLAVYYAEHDTHAEEKLKWWYWQDKKYPPEKD